MKLISCLEHLSENAVDFFSSITNDSFKLCYFPRIWKSCEIIPILKPYKSGKSPSSYTPIDLLLSVLIILEKATKARLISFIDGNNILPPRPFGFRKEHNNIQPLFKIRLFLHKTISSTGMILLAIKPVFHFRTMRRIFKMLHRNFPLKIVKIAKSFLKATCFNVYLGSFISQSIDISADHRQGQCLSLALYNIFTADTPLTSGCIVSIWRLWHFCFCYHCQFTSITYSNRRGFQRVEDST